jgi:two-component system, NarL family, sensor histidine kinase EvgS
LTPGRCRLGCAGLRRALAALGVWAAGIRARGFLLPTLLALVVALPALSAPPAELRFAEPTQDVSMLQAAASLSAEERAYLRGLPVLRVAVPTPPVRPYQTVAADGTVGGIHAQMLVRLARAYGLRLQPVSTPSWSATLAAIQRREVDVVMSVGVTAQHAQYLAFTLGATPSPGALYVRKPAPAQVAPPDQPRHPPLPTATFVLERDFLAHDFVRRQYPKARIVSVTTTGEALAALGQGKADYYLGSLLEANDWLGQDAQLRQQVQVHRLFNHGTGYHHFGVRKDWAPLATLLNRGIEALRHAPMPELAAAMGQLSDRIVLPQPIVLGPLQARRLIERPVWRIGAVRGLAMLNEFTSDGQHSGLGAEYAEQVAQQLGVGLQVVPFDDVAQMLDALRAGRIDLVPFLTRTAEREKELAFSEPYLKMPYMIIARSDAPLYWNLDSLRGKRLALATAHPLRELLARSYPDIGIVSTSNGQEAMDAVARGDAEAAVDVKLFANLRIQSDNDGELRAVAEVEELPAAFHFAAGPQTHDLIPIVNRALQEISPGERERIWRRWVAIELDPGFAWQRHLPLLVLGGAALLLLAGGTAFWMRRLRREVLQRRRSEERLADIGAALPCVAFRYAVDATQAVVGTGFYSAASVDLLGERPDPSLSLLDNIGPRLRAEHLNTARRLEQSASGSAQRLRFIAAYRHPDGRERWLHVEAVPKAVESGMITWTGTVVDISAERELQERVEHEAQARHLMLASASHELRAPTHTLSLALQSLAQMAPDSPLARAAALRVAQDAARRLGQLLNDVLDAARIDRGELHLRPQVVGLRELVEQVSLEAQAWASDKGLSFHAQIDPAVPNQAQLDPLRLRQILTNLLSNAVKYTTMGSVQLELRLEAASADGGGSLRFGVTDTGNGIAPQRLAHIFSPWTASDAGAHPVPEGSSGLGLSISRRLALMMGGDLRLSSEPGRGTQAVLTIPLPSAVVASMARPAAPSAAVLLCEDDPTSRLLMGQMLRSHGFPVIECADGEQALEAWRREPVQAIITDLQMDGMDGMTLVQRVRAEIGSKGHPRLVICSGNPVPVREPGDAPPPYDAWLTKPVEMSALVATLAELGVHAPRSAQPADRAVD